MARHFIKCNDCLTPFAVDLPDTFFRAPQIACPACNGKTTWMGEVYKDKLIEKVEKCACDSRCTCATGPSCDCACGGENHGTGRLITVIIAKGMAPQVMSAPVVNPELLEKVNRWKTAIAQAEKDYELHGNYKMYSRAFNLKKARSWAKRERLMFEVESQLAVA